MAKLNASGPKYKARQERARVRREANLINYEVNNFANARNPEHAVKGAKKDIENLNKKVPRY